MTTDTDIDYHVKYYALVDKIINKIQELDQAIKENNDDDEPYVNGDLMMRHARKALYELLE